MEEIRCYYTVIEKAFDKSSPYYDLRGLPMSRVRKQVSDLIASGDSLKVLDTGAQALAFARRSHMVVGIDLSEAIIKVAERKNHDGKVSFEVADATHLSYPNDSFDVSGISFALHDMPLTIRQTVLIEIQAELSVLLGVGRVWKGTKW